MRAKTLLPKVTLTKPLQVNSIHRIIPAELIQIHAILIVCAKHSEGQHSTYFTHSRNKYSSRDFIELFKLFIAVSNVALLFARGCRILISNSASY